MRDYEVIIIGAGVSGAAIARELSKYEVKCLVLEKELRDERVKGWNKAVKYAYGWAKEE